MEFWLNAGFIELSELAEIARAAEELGFAGIALPDHLFFPDTLSSAYPYSDDGSVTWPPLAPWADPWVAIAGMAAGTERLRFATGIQIAPLRDPFTLAKSIATAAALSGGRIRCGFGAGWLREEFDVMGVDFASRGRRMDEMLEVFRLLWSGETVAHRGEFFSFPALTMRPAAPDLPIHIGGNSLPAMQRAVRYQGWIGAHRSVAETEALLAQLSELRRRSALVDAPFHIGLTGHDLVDADHAALTRLGVDSVTLPIAALGRTRTRSLEERLAAIRRLAVRLDM